MKHFLQLKEPLPFIIVIRQGYLGKIFTFQVFKCTKLNIFLKRIMVSVHDFGQKWVKTGLGKKPGALSKNNRELWVKTRPGALGFHPLPISDDEHLILSIISLGSTQTL